MHNKDATRYPSLAALISSKSIGSRKQAFYILRIPMQTIRWSFPSRHLLVPLFIRESQKCHARMRLLMTARSLSTGVVDVEYTKPRRRRRAGARLPDTENIPSYKEFVHRFSVLSLYRNYLKEIRLMPHNQIDLKEQVQREFKANKTITDPFNVQRALTEGKRRFGELQEFTGSKNKYDGDSWLNTKDDEDPRGRVGTGWPWDRSS